MIAKTLGCRGWRIITVFLITTLSLLAGCTRAPQYTVPDYSIYMDDELTTAYYQVAMELEEAEDAYANLMYEYRSREGMEAAGYSLGTALGIAISGKEKPSTRVKRLRAYKAAILAEMHKRGMQLPH